jgi:aminocyclitol acetyltransferase
MIDGIPCGKYSYDHNIVAYCKSVGRFTSINGTVVIKGNHVLGDLSNSNVFFHTDLFSGKLKEQYDYINRIDGRDTGLRLTVGNDVWIGANVFINASTVATIGDGAIIGAGSIVTRDVPPYAVVYGSPAEIRRYRYTGKQIECLLKVKWWEWDDDTIRKNAEMFICPEKFFEKFM